MEDVACCPYCPKPAGATRATLLKAAVQHANRETVSGLQGHQWPRCRRCSSTAPPRTSARIYLRTFGGIALQRGSWNGPPIVIEKRRVRALLGSACRARAHHAHSRHGDRYPLARGRRRFGGQQPQPDGVSAEAISRSGVPARRESRVCDEFGRAGSSISRAHSHRSARDPTTSWATCHGDLGPASGRSNQERSPSSAASSWPTCATNRGHRRLQLSVHNEVRAQLLPIATAARSVVWRASGHGRGFRACGDRPLRRGRDLGPRRLPYRHRAEGLPPASSCFGTPKISGKNSTRVRQTS